MEAYEKEFVALTNQVSFPCALPASWISFCDSSPEQDVTVRRLEERLRQVRAAFYESRLLQHMRHTCVLTPSLRLSCRVKTKSALRKNRAGLRLLQTSKRFRRSCSACSYGALRMQMLRAKCLTPDLHARRSPPSMDRFHGPSHSRLPLSLLRQAAVAAEDSQAELHSTIASMRT